MLLVAAKQIHRFFGVEIIIKPGYCRLQLTPTQTGTQKPRHRLISKYIFTGIEFPEKLVNLDYDFRFGLMLPSVTRVHLNRFEAFFYLA